MILRVMVHEGNIQDYNGGKLLLEPLADCFARLKLIWADSAYNKGGFVAWVKETFGWEVEIVEHPWTGLRGVWAPKDAVIDWEKIRQSRLPRVEMARDCGEDIRLAFHLASASLRLRSAPKQ
jgi:hypothetical protein